MFGAKDAKNLHKIYIFFTISTETSNFFDCAEMIYFLFHARYIFFYFSSAEWIIQLLKGMKNKWDGFENVINHVKFFFLRRIIFICLISI